MRDPELELILEALKSQLSAERGADPDFKYGDGASTALDDAIASLEKHPALRHHATREPR